MTEDNDDFAEYFFEEFHGFVESHYSDNRTIGWNGLVRENTVSDNDGFQIFMSLVRQFASEFESKRI
ncbi:hypothetical protein [Ascidiaceihabitans sp.]